MTTTQSVSTLNIKAPKQIHAQNTKQRICDAALHILSEKGFNYLTVSNICEVANVSNGTFFYHFKTKDALFVTITYNDFADYREAHHFKQAVEGLAFDQRILRFYYSWADYMEDLGIEFFSNFYNTKNYSLDIRLWNHRKPFDVWNYPGECLKEALEAGLLKKDISIDHCADVLGTLIKGVAFNWCLSNGAFDMHERIKEVMLPYLNSIRATPDDL